MSNTYAPSPTPADHLAGDRHDHYLQPPATAATSHGSAVSWGAILAGAVAAATLSLILLIIGSGLGLASVSPWSRAGAGAAAVGISTVAWLTFTQLAASGMGGYLAGRLRQKWVNVHTDESYFRDTAHGFLAWCVATLGTAVLLASTIASIIGTGVQAGASVAGDAATAAVTATAGAAGATASNGMGNASTAYFVDTLFRRDPGAAVPPTNPAPAGAMAMSSGSPASTATPDHGVATTAEVTRIIANGLRSGTALPAEDVRYVGQLVAQRTGLSQADAEKRVTDTYNRIQARTRDAEAKAREAADTARKASAYAALWLSVSLIFGAFVASLAATFGGRRRDL